MSRIHFYLFSCCWRSVLPPTCVRISVVLVCYHFPVAEVLLSPSVSLRCPRLLHHHCCRSSRGHRLFFRRRPRPFPSPCCCTSCCHHTLVIPLSVVRYLFPNVATCVFPRPRLFFPPDWRSRRRPDSRRRWERCTVEWCPAFAVWPSTMPYTTRQPRLAEYHACQSAWRGYGRQGRW